MEEGGSGKPPAEVTCGWALQDVKGEGRALQAEGQLTEGPEQRRRLALQGTGDRLRCVPGEAELLGRDAITLWFS